MTLREHLLIKPTGKEYTWNLVETHIVMFQSLLYIVYFLCSHNIATLKIDGYRCYQGCDEFIMIEDANSDDVTLSEIPVVIPPRETKDKSKE